MDPNQIQQPTQPVQTPTPPPSMQGKQSSTNKLLIGVAMVVFLVVIGIGVYLYFLLPQKESGSTAQTTYQTATPTAAPTVVQTAEEREAELIDIGTLDADFADIDQDLQSL